MEDRKLRDMFVSEAVITANLVHPNIVPVHDLGQTEDGKLFYSMKKVEGTPWNKRLLDMTREEKPRCAHEGGQCRGIRSLQRRHQPRP